MERSVLCERGVNQLGQEPMNGKKNGWVGRARRPRTKLFDLQIEAAVSVQFCRWIMGNQRPPPVPSRRCSADISLPEPRSFPKEIIGSAAEITGGCISPLPEPRVIFPFFHGRDFECPSVSMFWLAKPPASSEGEILWSLLLVARLPILHRSSSWACSELILRPIVSTF
jgi:hypothetical protein